MAKITNDLQWEIDYSLLAKQLKQAGYRLVIENWRIDEKPEGLRWEVQYILDTQSNVVWVGVMSLLRGVAWNKFYRRGILSLEYDQAKIWYSWLCSYKKAIKLTEEDLEKEEEYFSMVDRSRAYQYWVPVETDTVHFSVGDTSKTISWHHLSDSTNPPGRF